MTYTFKTNMTCQHCIRTVTPFLNELEFIEEWQVDLGTPDSTLTVELDEDHPEQVMEAVKKAGFEVEMLAPMA